MQDQLNFLTLGLKNCIINIDKIVVFHSHINEKVINRVFHSHISEKVINRVFHDLIIEKVKIKRRYRFDTLLLFFARREI